MNKNKYIILWLLSGCIMILIMVLIGGITRLTDSGLSMVNWKLFMGAMPPLNEIQWQETFELYKQSPEFKKINSHYTIKEFKVIFFWEYLHRLLGRLLGIIFIVPFCYFLIRKQLNKKLFIQSLVLFFMGSLQAAIGWWMVKSGLVDRPDVSHFRLSIHLITAFLTCCLTLWIALPLIFPKKKQGNKTLFRSHIILFILLIIQIIYGGFVAGLDAGYSFNTWPKMNGEWLPEALYAIKPTWKNFTENRAGIQFVHRTLALIIVSLIIVIRIIGSKLNIKNHDKLILNIILYLCVFQTVIGIFTLILKVPFSLAILHQLVAFFLLMSVVYSIFLFKKS